VRRRLDYCFGGIFGLDHLDRRMVNSYSSVFMFTCANYVSGTMAVVRY